jgi:polyhydroxyalkanoate synthesis repressor PhaR
MMLIPIKRYQNRKLYNTVTKRYITLVEVGELIRGGMDIVVTDSASGEDITTFILSQVIVGQENRGERTLSQGLLTGLIRAHIDTLEAVRQLLHGSPNWTGFLSTLGIPTREDFDGLNAKIEVLTRAIDAIGLEDDERGRK